MSTVVLDNGNWLIGTGAGACFFEIDPNDNVVWMLKPEDVPEIGLKYAAGMQRLKDGTTVLTAFTSGFTLFAVNKEKKVLWKWNPSKKKGYAKRLTNVQVLEESGDPVNFE